MCRVSVRHMEVWCCTFDCASLNADTVHNGESEFISRAKERRAEASLKQMTKYGSVLIFN